jgi:putative hemolysin
VNGTLRDILIVIVFVLVGGVFAAAEIALVSLRESQVRNLASRGKRGQTVARLNADPNRFLSAVQIGVTLAGFMASAFGGATLARKITPTLRDWGMSPGVADVVALVLITILVAYVSIVLGELAAKRLAMQRAESFALWLAPIVDWMAKVSRPAIWFLSVSTNAVLRLVGGDPRAQREQITDEELRELVSGHETLGEDERQILNDVFEAGDRQIREVMVPRTEVDFLDAAAPVYKAVKQALERPHSRYPVTRDSSDDVVGFVHVRDLLAPELSGRSVRVAEVTRDVLTLPSTRHIIAALTDMRRENAHLAIVMDEYGGTAGVVTLEDLVEELVGDIRDEYDTEEGDTTRHLTGDVDVDGLLNLDDFEDETGIELPDGPYETVAGFIVNELGHVPAMGETVEYEGNRLKVTELDGRRIARVRVTPPPHQLAAPDGSPVGDGDSGHAGDSGSTGSGGGSDDGSDDAGDRARDDAPQPQDRASAGESGERGTGDRRAPQDSGTNPSRLPTR